jgi:hypothetical protein
MGRITSPLRVPVSFAVFDDRVFKGMTGLALYAMVIAMFSLES